MFDVGFTATVAPLAIPVKLKLVTPSVYTTLYVPDAGRVKTRFVLPPLQTEAVPLIDAMGEELTVTTALPVMLGLGAVTVQEAAVVFVILTIV